MRNELFNGERHNTLREPVTQTRRFADLCDTVRLHKCVWVSSTCVSGRLEDRIMLSDSLYFCMHKLGLTSLLCGSDLSYRFRDGLSKF